MFSDDILFTLDASVDTAKELVTIRFAVERNYREYPSGTITMEEYDWEMLKAILEAGKGVFQDGEVDLAIYETER